MYCFAWSIIDVQPFGGVAGVAVGPVRLFVLGEMTRNNSDVVISFSSRKLMFMGANTQLLR